MSDISLTHNELTHILNMLQKAVRRSQQEKDDPVAPIAAPIDPAAPIPPTEPETYADLQTRSYGTPELRTITEQIDAAAAAKTSALTELKLLVRDRRDEGRGIYALCDSLVQSSADAILSILLGGSSFVAVGQDTDLTSAFKSAIISILDSPAPTGHGKGKPSS